MLHRRPSAVRLARYLIAALLALCALGPIHADGAHAAAKVGVSTFYSTTKDAYTKWIGTSSTARPAKTTSFPCDTKTVGFYFEYANAVPKHTQLQILVYLHTGNSSDPKTPEAHSTTSTASYKAGMSMRTVTEKSGFEGPYRAVLMVDGHAAAHTDFTVMVNGGEC